MMKRRGITMTEVLITLFVLAIGLLALLTLFPLAAMNMQQAIQDDRVGHAAAATALADMFNDFRPANESSQQGVVAGSYYRNGLGSLGAAVDDGPSHPIYIDPLGALTSTSVGGVIPRVNCSWTNNAVTNDYGNPNIPRLNPNFDSQYRLNDFALTDDMVFDKNGIPAGNPSNGLQREMRYSWAYMLRRPRTACASVVDVTVVIYANRPMYTAGVASGEISCTASGTIGSNLISNVSPSGKTGIRKGIWLLDVSPGANRTINGPINALWYRVMNVQATGGTYAMEVQPALKATVSKVLIMENVADVFDKGAGWQAPRDRTNE